MSNEGFPVPEDFALNSGTQYNVVASGGVILYF